MSRYIERMSHHGTTRRERTVSQMREYLSRRLPESISYKPVKLNGVDTSLVIDKGTKPYYKKYRSLPKTDPDFHPVVVGDYIEWAGVYWIVINADSDDELFIDGELYQCNYLLRWQDEMGNIIERWCHASNASAYNTGKYYYDVATLGTNQLMIILPFDDDTRKLTRDKRVFCDYTNKNIRYRFARVDAIQGSYGQGKSINIIMTEDIEHHNSDNVELQICDYFDPSSNISQDLSADVIAYINYVSDYIRLRSDEPRVYTVEFKDRDGNLVDGITAEWVVESEYAVNYTIDGNSISISCDNEKALGSRVTLKIVNAGCEASIELPIRRR